MSSFPTLELEHANGLTEARGDVVSFHTLK